MKDSNCKKHFVKADKNRCSSTVKNLGFAAVITVMTANGGSNIAQAVFDGDPNRSLMGMAFSAAVGITLGVVCYKAARSREEEIENNDNDNDNGPSNNM